VSSADYVMNRSFVWWASFVSHNWKFGFM